MATKIKKVAKKVAKKITKRVVKRTAKKVAKKTDRRTAEKIESNLVLTEEKTILERREALCNYCGKRKDNCIRSDLGIPVPETELKEVMLDWGYNIFGGIKGGEITEVYIETGKTFVKDTDICEDCIKKIAKLIGKDTK